jgi:hypothetical protein
MISEKVKEYLNRKLIEKEHTLRKIKRKHLTIKCLYVGSVIVSVVLSSSAAAITAAFGPPLAPQIIVLCFTTTSAITTSLSAKFHLKKKKERLQIMSDELTRIKDKIDYVVSCNGNLSESEYNEILKEFT